MNNVEFPLFETIAIYRGKLLNIAYHQRRYEHSVRRYYANQRYHFFELEAIICAQFTPTPPVLSEWIRCRIDYNHCAYRIGFYPYQRKVHRRFKPVICDDIDYSLKYSDRKQLDSLVAQKEDYDEILIIQHGRITDCSIGNLILRQNNRWYTPSTPLLYGTQRAYLLAEQKIFEREIFAHQLEEYEEIRLINALNGLD